MVTQRLMKAWLAKAPQPYSVDDLKAIAVRCTLMEDNARKVSAKCRSASCRAAPRIGQSFPASSPASTITAPSSAPSTRTVDGSGRPGRQGPRRRRQGDCQTDLTDPQARVLLTSRVKGRPGTRNVVMALK